MSKINKQVDVSQAMRNFYKKGTTRTPSLEEQLNFLDMHEDVIKKVKASGKIVTELEILKEVNNNPFDGDKHFDDAGDSFAEYNSIASAQVSYPDPKTDTCGTFVTALVVSAGKFSTQALKLLSEKYGITSKQVSNYTIFANMPCCCIRQDYVPYMRKVLVDKNVDYSLKRLQKTPVNESDLPVILDWLFFSGECDSYIGWDSIGPVIRESKYFYVPIIPKAMKALITQQGWVFTMSKVVVDYEIA